MADASERADALKDKANKLYSSGNPKEAAKLYEEAFHLSPKPVYLSNLSAAQYEMGAYAEAHSTIVRALGLLEITADAIWSKLHLRSVRCHLMLRDWEGAFEEIADVLAEDVSKDVKNAIVDLKKLVSQARDATRSYMKDEARWKKAVVDLPRYRPNPSPDIEYYNTGHDRPCSVLTAQDLEWGHHIIEEKRMRIALPTDGRSYEFSALFGGIGDARNFYATLWDIGNQLEEQKGKRRSSLKLHFTLVDIHPTAIARDLVILYSLDELSKMSDTKFKSPRARLILSMLHFTYWGTVMPPSLYTAMLEKIRLVRDDFSGAAATNSPVANDWLFIDRESVQPVLESLEWWLGSGQMKYTVSDMLAHRTGYPSITQISGGDPAVAASEAAQREADKEDLLASLNNPQVQEDIRRQAAEYDKTYDEFFELVKNDIISGATDPRKYSTCPEGCSNERLQFDHIRILWPAQDVEEPDNFRKALQMLPTVSIDAHLGRSLINPLTDVINNRIKTGWKPNITYVDRNWHLDLSHNAFEEMFGLIACRHIRPYLPKRASRLSDYSDCIFSHTARSIRRLLRLGQDAFKTEILVGDVWKVAEGISLDTLDRPAFPRLYDRIHMSNVPDYTGGHASFLPHTVPLLKDHPQAYFTANCILYANLFGPDSDPTKCADDYAYQFSATTQKRLPIVYGLEPINKQISLGLYTTYVSAKSPSLALSRDELTNVLYGLFMRCVVPPPFKKANVSTSPREPLNVHALFRLLRVLGRLHPGHVFADFIASILEDKGSTTVELHEYSPIPVPDGRSSRKHGISCLPFLAEFEAACAIWAPLLPFPLACKVPQARDIETYSINFRTVRVSDIVDLNGDSMAMMLIVGSKKELEDRKGISQLRRRLWESAQCPTTINLISTFHWTYASKTAHVLLTKARTSGFTQQDLHCAIINTVWWRVTSSVEPCSRMRQTGDLYNQIPKVTLEKPVGKAPKADSLWQSGFGMHNRWAF